MMEQLPIPDRLIKILRFTPHRTYADVFGGVPGVLVLMNKEPSPVEVINDLDGWISDFFLTIADKSKLREMQNEVERLRSDTPPSPIDLQGPASRSAWLYLALLWGGKPVEVRNFRTRWLEEAVRGHLASLEGLYEIHQRIQRVQLDNRHVLSFLRTYDTEQTLFLLVPPGDFGFGSPLPASVRNRLIALLPSIRGSWVMFCRESDDLHPLEKVAKKTSLPSGLALYVRLVGYPRTMTLWEMMDNP